MCLLALTLFLVFSQSREISQESHKSTIVDSSGVITSVVQEGVRYFIKIVPGDTTKIDRMPIYAPSATDKFVPYDQAPTPLTKVNPIYPEEARRNGVEGTVWLNCLVGRDGEVRKVAVLRSDAEILSEAAVRAVFQWVFSPAEIKGKPVAAWISLPFKFRLDE